jgi:hypothetical protein
VRQDVASDGDLDAIERTIDTTTAGRPSGQDVGAQEDDAAWRAFRALCHQRQPS